MHCITASCLTARSLSNTYSYTSVQATPSLEQILKELKTQICLAKNDLNTICDRCWQNESEWAFLWSFFNHSTDCLEQDIIGKHASALSISNEDFDLIWISLGGNLHMKNMTPLLFVLSILHFSHLRSPWFAICNNIWCYLTPLLRFWGPNLI
jgi:hypothetical protein